MMKKVIIAKDWDEVLEREINSNSFKERLKALDEEYKNKQVYPSREDIFNAFKLTSFENLKVVILGQDPYHGEGQAEGLAFSVKKGIRKPLSLKNIYKELKSDLNIDEADHGSLKSWAKEGVLLFNAIFTVEAHKAASHRHYNWEEFSDQIISKISKEKNNIVFILWGNFAISKEALIDKSKHLVIKSPHPSPFSARKGFFGSQVFSKTNKYLKSKNIKEINWEIK